MDFDSKSCGRRLFFDCCGAFVKPMRIWHDLVIRVKPNALGTLDLVTIVLSFVSLTGTCALVSIGGLRF